MQEGSLRCDVNISVRPQGAQTLGTRTEIKNMNSLSFISKALRYEFDRQTALLESGGEVVQETRRFNEKTGKTESMRSKEDAHDYRYFPEPDLVDILRNTASRSRIAQTYANTAASPSISMRCANTSKRRKPRQT